MLHSRSFRRSTARILALTALGFSLGAAAQPGPAEAPLGSYAYVQQLSDLPAVPPVGYGVAAPPSPQPGEAAETLARTQNLEAFARLLAVIRFFHPSDEGSRCDWNRFAAAAVPQVEAAASPRELAARLRALFAPVAPTVRIFPLGEPAPLTPPALLPPNGDESKLRRVEWRHYGVELDLANEPRRKKSVLGSERIDNRSELGWGNLVQSLPAAPLRGRKIRLAAGLDVEVGRAQLWLRVDRPFGQRGFFDNMADRPVREPGWREAEIVGTVDPDAESITLGVAFTTSGDGEGRVRIDDVRLEAMDEGEPVRVRLENADFSRGETRMQPPGWTFPYESVRAGYRLGLLIGPPCRNGGCAEIEAGKIATPPFPAPAETYGLELPGGVRVEVPITLYADARGTLPHAEEGLSCAPEGSSPDARAERLAALLVAWGTIDLFRPYTVADGAPPGWGEALHRALPAAMRAADDRAFLVPFRRMLFELADGNARVLRDDLDPASRLPFEWRFVDPRWFYVTRVAPGFTALRVGDSVGSVDGVMVHRHPLLQGREVSAATPEARRAQGSKLFLFGDQGSEVSLAVESPGEYARRVEAKRSWPAGKPLAPPRGAPISEPATGIVVLELGRVDDASFEAALPRLARAHGLIFDLRGRTDLSNRLIAHLIDRTARGPRLLLSVRVRPDGLPLDWLETFWTIAPAEPHLEARCAFLLDERSQGYAETLLAMIAHEHRCDLVGSRSAGTNGSVNQLNLPRGFTLTFTSLKVENPDGTRHYGIGVEPTVPVKLTQAGIAAGRDEVLEAAIALLKR